MASLSGNSKIRKLCENRLKKYFENASMEKKWYCCICSSVRRNVFCALYTSIQASFDKYVENFNQKGKKMYCTAFDHAQVSQPATEKALENEVGGWVS